MSINHGAGRFYAGWLLEVGALWAVDAFAMVSGYVHYNHKFKIRRILELWLQAFFWNFVITGAFMAASSKYRNLHELIKGLLPVTFSGWWYFSIYFGLFFFIPFFNFILENMSRKNLNYLLLIIVLLFVVYTTAVGAKAPFGVNDGYSLIWLSALYLIGGYIKKYDCFSNVKPAVSFAVFAGFLLLTYLIEMLYHRHFGRLCDSLISYSSPFVLGAACCIFLCFLRMRIHRKAAVLAIQIFSPAAFGVYLIHSHRLMWSYLYGFLIGFYPGLPCLKLVLAVILSAAVLYTVCTLLELVRIRLFRLIRVNQFTVSAEGFFQKLLAKCRIEI